MFKFSVLRLHYVKGCITVVCQHYNSSFNIHAFYTPGIYAAGYIVFYTPGIYAAGYIVFYTPGIYAVGYIVFALTFVRSYVRSFVCSFVRYFPSRS